MTTSYSAVTHGVLLMLALAPLQAVTLRLASPLDYRVVQRQDRDHGNLVIEGRLTDAQTKGVFLEARIHTNGTTGEWRPVSARFDGERFSGTTEIPAGGWHRLELRASTKDRVLADAAVEHVGVGEVFVVAGQSNAANHGQERQSTTSGQVVAFDGEHWQTCNDPQPGASGAGGSFLPPFGDAIAQRFGVPVGVVACGIGATSVREWLPKGAKFPNPPTLTGRIRQLPDGQWESNGEAFDMLVARMKQLGPRGFRAVLWHQGESDANQQDPTRTLPGELYREYLERLIFESRQALGWEAPWFVAQVSYHVPGEEASPEIRAAQASLWEDGIALPGPDSDALKGDLRENDGKGVHFSGPGLRAHAAAWVEKVAPWLEQRLGLAPNEWNLRGWHHPGFPRKEASDPADLAVAELIRAREKNALPWQYSMADALFSASFLNACLRHAEDVGMANIAPIVNTRGPLFVHPKGLVKRTTFHTLALYANELETRVARTHIDAGLLVQGSEFVPVVDAVATVDPSGKSWALALVNRHPSKQVPCEVRMTDTLLEGTYAATILAGDSPDAYNDVRHPDRVVPERRQLTFSQGVVNLLPHSLTIVPFITERGQNSGERL